MPDNCDAYGTEEDAIEGLNSIYELSKRQLTELKVNGITELRRDQGGSYCEVSACSCDEPWEHSEWNNPDSWMEYREEDEV